MLSRAEFHRYAQPKILLNGLLVTTLPWSPNLREVAFEKGAAVVIYTERRGKGFWVQIQRSRNYPQLTLDNVAAALREAEARARNIPTNGKNLRQIGEDPDTQWFLHDSRAFVACGTRTHPLKGEELSKLNLATIVGYVHQALGAIPQGIVKSWSKNS